MRVLHHVGFFVPATLFGERCRLKDLESMKKFNPAIAEQIAKVVTTFQKERTGQSPKSVAVALNGDTLVITLYEALTPAEKAAAQTPDGASKVREFHRQLFAATSELLRREIQQILETEVTEAVAEIQMSQGAVEHVFTSGTMVQVFLLAEKVPSEVWN